MKGHHHPENLPLPHRLIHFFTLRRRSNETDHIVVTRYVYGPAIRTLVSGHHDEPLTWRGFIGWWAGGIIVVGGVVLLAIFAVR
jgi:hypothetical protein